MKNAPASVNRNVLVTGATGFIGRHLCLWLQSAGYRVRAAVRRVPDARIEGAAETVAVGDIGLSTSWAAALRGIDCVVHLAGRAHVMLEREADPLAAYRSVNVDGTRCLAQAAAQQGVKRFVFISTIKVNGESSQAGADVRPFSEDMPVAPKDPYAVSKWEAERSLLQVCHDCRMEPVILRLPLVYGRGVKANFLELVRLVRTGMPLPLASLKNRRSLIYIENLCSLIALALSHPRAAGQLFLVSDGEDLSTPQLIRLIAEAAGVKARMFPFPVFLLRVIAAAAGRQAALLRLVGSLCVDNQKSIALLGWKPLFSAAQGIRRTLR